MSAYAALLRAVNVGGTGKLAMSDLKVLCEKCGFGDVKTYIQSGNVVFTSKLGEPKARAALERELEAKMGKPVGVHLRTPAELATIVEKNPFATVPPNRLLVLFLDRPPPKDALQGIVAPDGEELALGDQEIFIHYPNGMGRSKLKIPFAKTGTGRNLNTVKKLLDLARALER
jgi:uncharacterized protein (DUF1697 family)